MTAKRWRSYNWFMPAITIPRSFTKDDLVVVPKREYEEFAKWKKSIKVRLNERWFWTTEWQKKEAEADRAIQQGRIIGPFSDYKKLLKALSKRRKTK